METRNPLSKDISIAYRMSNSFFDARLTPFHIGCGQQFFLLEIAKRPGIGQHELRFDGNFDKSTITRALKKLEEEGYILREIDKKDKRILRLYPTKAAAPVIEATKASIMEWHNLLTKDMNPEEITQCHILINKIARNAENAKHNL